MPAERVSTTEDASGPAAGNAQPEHGSETAIKAAGKMRTEGRDYALQAEDVCHFLIGK